ncbi:MAG TPA: response regulator transcription factor [Vicinamibacterales bacterium]|nr:response regulator transcription factor [Vicinamibacterales bacterium]
MATSIRVIVAATEPLLAAGCRFALGVAPEISVVAECPTMRSMIRALRVHRPHVLVIDSAICDRDPFEACARIPQAAPETNIAWLVRPRIRPPIQDGFPQIVAVLPPQVASEQLVECVRALAARRPWKMPPQPADAATAMDPAAGNSPLALLTFRERQIVLGVTSGKRNREIAESLGITPGTVKLHLHKAFAKLGVHSRLALFRKLVQEAHSSRSRVG